MFESAPVDVWHWYLFRFGICQDAQPNAGHAALVRLERALGPRFTLITQNIDGLHRRAGSERVYCIHGDAAYVRCAADCGAGVLAQPPIRVAAREDTFSAEDLARLHCPRCGGWLRPHVLWFDEFYDEPNYRMDSALRAATEADLLLVVGTSGATNLPWQIGRLAFQRGAAMVDVNPEENPFADLALRLPRGFYARGSACERLPAIVEALGA
jgi:NAD-dependent deacetylase